MVFPSHAHREIYEQELGNTELLDQHESGCNRACCWWSPPSDFISVQFCQETNLHGLKYLAQEKRHIVERYKNTAYQSDLTFNNDELPVQQTALGIILLHYITVQYLIQIISEIPATAYRKFFIVLIFWLLAFLFGIFAAAYLISDVWRKYKRNPVILAFDPNDMPISQLPFPAITICNVNKVQNSFARRIQRNLRSDDNEVVKNAQTDNYLMRSVCSSKPSFANRIKEGKRLIFKPSEVRAPQNDSSNYISDFLYRASQPCSEMIQRCIWGDEELPCEELFHPIITELGICCTFNMMPLKLLLKFYEARSSTMNNSAYCAEFEGIVKRIEVDAEQWERANPSQANFLDGAGELPRRQKQAGQTHALSLLLFPDLDNYFCTATDSNGFRVAAHTAFSRPHVLDLGMAVPPGTDVYVDVNAEVTTAEEIITQFSVADRQCYFETERELKYFKYYTQTNCIDECITDLNRSNCSCAWYYQPMDNETKVCEPDPVTLSCTRSVTQQVTRHGVTEMCEHCLPLCTTIEYQLESSLSGLQNASTLWESHEDANESKPIWLGKPVTVLSLFYREQSTVPKIRKELYGSTDLFANTGGLLGLCLGFSGLSAIEMIYFCTLRVWFKRKRLRHRARLLATKFIRALKRLSGRSSSAEKQITLQKSSIPILVMNQQDYLTSKLMWQKFGKPTAAMR